MVWTPCNVLNSARPQTDTSRMGDDTNLRKLWKARLEGIRVRQRQASALGDVLSQPQQLGRLTLPIPAIAIDINFLRHRLKPRVIIKG